MFSIVDELKPGGSLIQVTNENKTEFVNLIMEHRLRGRIREQFLTYSIGFYRFVANQDFAFFNGEELDLLICG
jgi:E3 ubiquitin-protein ligase NEDD4